MYIPLIYFFMFTPIWGRWTHSDGHIFQMGGRKPPTSEGFPLEFRILWHGDGFFRPCREVLVSLGEVPFASYTSRLLPAWTSHPGCLYFSISQFPIKMRMVHLGCSKKYLGNLWKFHELILKKAIHLEKGNLIIDAWYFLGGYPSNKSSQGGPPTSI